MHKSFTLILLTGLCFAQTKPEPAKVAAPLPDVPVTYQTQFLPLVIKQKDIQIDELQLSARYLADVKAADQANAEGQALEVKVLTELKLDPKKYTTAYQGDKMVIMERK